MAQGCRSALAIVWRSGGKSYHWMTTSTRQLVAEPSAFCNRGLGVKHFLIDSSAGVTLLSAVGARAEAEVVIENVAAALQNGMSAFELGVTRSIAIRGVRCQVQRSSGNGPDRNGMSRLRALAHCATVLHRASDGRNRGCLSRVKAGRRNRGGWVWDLADFMLG